MLNRCRYVLAAHRAEQIWIDCSLLIVLVTRQRGVAEVCRVSTGTCSLPVAPSRYVWMLLSRYGDVPAAHRDD